MNSFQSRPVRDFQCITVMGALIQSPCRLVEYQLGTDVGASRGHVDIPEIWPKAR